MMRRVLTALAALSLAATLVPEVASAQAGRPGGPQSGQAPDQGTSSRAREVRIAPLSRRANAGPCPYVKVLYDAARFVEMADFTRPTVAGVGFTGEIEGISADCVYREDDPIRLDMNILFNLGRGASAQGDARTYRYWVAVTERNSAVLAKEYFDLPVDFAGQTTTSVEQGQTIVIPRADATTSGGVFEVLIGFEVTPEMAEFNRSGSRFRITAGQND
ncbi:Tat pathway signal sequence domain protein [Brevundimonas vesicularis]|uniref:Tat pathway signal sequence domain protein n=1 Tax=Brevundimonas vesicularis TaxID=41276 RepID=UPI0038D4DC56